jgi:hypothetical protein
MAEELENGWRRTTPDDDTLLRRFVLAGATRVAWTAERLGGQVVRRDDAVLADCGSATLFDNWVVLLSDAHDADLEAVAAAARALYQDRSWVLVSALPVPDLSPLGLELMGHPPAMFRPAGGTSPATPEGLRIVEVTDAEAMADWNATFGQAFPAPGGHPSPYDERVLGGPYRFWVGYDGDRPVATSAAFVSHGMIDVEGVSTMPDLRGRGYGEALTWSATMAEPSLPAALVASDPGRPVYERMGYVPLLRFTLWYED